MEIKFADQSQPYGDDQNLTIKWLLFNFLNKIGNFAGNEFRGGYWEEKVKIINNLAFNERYYVQDVREQYCNEVFFLADILAPHFDEPMKEEEAEFNKQIDELFDSMCVEDGDEKVIQLYRDRKVRIVQKLFRSLNMFIQRIDYFNRGNLAE